MNIKKFERYVPNMESTVQDPYYEICKLDRNGDEESLSDEMDFEFNPYDLNEAVEEYIKYEGYNKNWFIKKITEEIVDLNTIPEMELILKSKRYNL